MNNQKMRIVQFTKLLLDYIDVIREKLNTRHAIMTLLQGDATEIQQAYFEMINEFEARIMSKLPG